jgi:hypothetical protein
MIQESWRYRPFSIGAFFGLAAGGRLIRDWIREDQGAMGGFQVGWDFSHYCGGEMRLGWAEIGLVDSDTAIAAQKAMDDAYGLTANDLHRRRFLGVRTNGLFFWDTHALIYPWGDSAIRPYVLLGLGSVTHTFVDRVDVAYSDTLFTVPVGLGVKYRITDFIAARFECADYVSLGSSSRFGTIQRLLVTGGVEVRFGGPRRPYWPWNPGRHYW